ncbi:MAG: ammonium transporter [Alphaproteobacteria bacterium]|nr:ammonium transporter [Alphaproteobacteria bacterium]MBL6945386.1 ammonium transporter [Rhodospirillales bacterium]
MLSPCEHRDGGAANAWFSGVWQVIVDAPICHWVWGGGWLSDMGVMDLAGGLVVHTTAEVSALVVVALLGNRRGFPNDVKPPHNPGMTMIGASMLWVGWFGFNAGSALAADASAAMAMTGLRVGQEDEFEGLDITTHGERGYEI